MRTVVRATSSAAECAVIGFSLVPFSFRAFATGDARTVISYKVAESREALGNSRSAPNLHDSYTRIYNARSEWGKLRGPLNRPLFEGKDGFRISGDQTSILFFLASLRREKI